MNSNVPCNFGQPYLSTGITMPTCPLPDFVVPRSNIADAKPPFPWKLHALLADAAVGSAKFHDIVSWLPGGHAFRIHKPNVFAIWIMPKYFHQTKLESFVRQLYMYGFTKIEDGEYRGAYFHPRFSQENRVASLALTRNRHSDRRLKKHFPDKESIVSFLAKQTKYASSSGSIGRASTDNRLTQIHSPEKSKNEIMLHQGSSKASFDLMRTTGKATRGHIDLGGTCRSHLALWGSQAATQPNSFLHCEQPWHPSECYDLEVHGECCSGENRQSGATNNGRQNDSDRSIFAIEPRSIEEMSRDPIWRTCRAKNLVGSF